MFGMGGMELVVILLVALLVFGPEQLPELARKLARIITEVRRAGEEVRMQVDPDGELYRATHFPPIPDLPRYLESELDTSETEEEPSPNDTTDREIEE